MFFENFIYAQENALAPELCDELIEKTNYFREKAFSDNQSLMVALSSCVSMGEHQFSESGLGRSDIQFYMPRYLPEYVEPINSALMQAKMKYDEGVWTAGLVPMYSNTIKLQITKPSGGYHNWHIEQSTGNTACRALAWMIYLNDVEDGGETEFLYQSVRVKPERGKICIWPAGVTHPHRGNPPLAGEKYVLTGWFEYDIYLLQEMQVYPALSQRGEV